MLRNGQAKLAAKGCDLLVVNQVGGGLAFGTADNEAVVLAADGSQTEVPHGPKEVLADVVWDLRRGPAQPVDQLVPFQCSAMLSRVCAE